MSSFSIPVDDTNSVRMQKIIVMGIEVSINSTRGMVQIRVTVFHK